MKKKLKKGSIKRLVAMVCAAIVALAFIASIVMPAVMAASKSDVNRAKKETEEARAELQEAERKRKEILAQYQALEKQILDTQTQISEIKGEIFRTETEIVIKEEELKVAEGEYEEYKEIFKVRARAMYENTDVDYLEIFFGAEDFGDLLSKIEIVSQIMKYDQKILTKLDDTKKKIIKTKAELEENHKRLIDEAAALEAKRVELEPLSLEKQKMLVEITNDVELYRMIYEAAEAAEAATIKEYEDALSKDANPTTYSGGKFQWPVPSSSKISSKYGNRLHPVYKVQKFHAGIDIGAQHGKPIVAAADGVVTMAATNGGYGQCIIINHGSGLATLYGHCSELLVSKGDTVKKGDKIGLIGSTGVSTGPHLHFEVRENGSTRDPLNYLKK